ncbi:hypothetical protein A5692_12280 [Mycobacterium sp. E342]|nr:hypothetical protein A9X04_22220 [Mycobacterium sp. E3247]OBH35230.1 hypothetical protein A5692_12280 [Mycobacterium sp. E342]
MAPSRRHRPRWWLTLRQRSNEDTNRFLRQYFPDNTTLNAYTVERPLAVEYKINQPTLACRW